MLQTLPQAFPRQLSQPQPQPSVFKGVQDCRLPALKPFKPLRKPFQGNSRSYTPQLCSRAFKLSPFARPQTPQCFKPFRKPFQGNSRSYTPQPSVFKGVQDCRLPALKPFKPFRRPFQGNSCSFPQAFPRQLSQLHAPDTASNPSACLSKATLAATRPSHLFVRDSRLPFARPHTLQTLPQAFPRHRLQASRKPFQGNSRSYTPQTTLQTLPQAFPRQLSQLQAPSHLFLRAFKTAVCPKPFKLLKPFRKPFQQ